MYNSFICINIYTTSIVFIQILKESETIIIFKILTVIWQLNCTVSKAFTNILAKTYLFLI